MISLVVEFNADENPRKMGTFSQYQYPHTQARYAECARFCGINAKDDAEAVKKLIEKIEELKEDRWYQVQHQGVRYRRAGLLRQTGRHGRAGIR